VTLEESIASNEVISCEVTFAERMTRRKSLNHCAEWWSGKAASSVSGDVGSADWWLREGWVKAWEA